MLGLIGKKIGMTAIFTPDGVRVPVTVIQSGPCPIAQIKDVEKDGYKSIQLAFEPTRKYVSKPIFGHFKKSNIVPHKHLVEFRLDKIDDKYKVGELVTLSIFNEGEIIDCTGTSKGKGFQGGVKRHHFKGGSRTHGQSDRERAPGSIGSSSYPSRVYRGLKMASHMGNQQVTVKKIRIEKIIPENSLILIKDSVPGPKGGIVILRKR